MGVEITDRLKLTGFVVVVFFLYGKVFSIVILFYEFRPFEFRLLVM